MNTIIWILQVVLTLFFLFAGLRKIMIPKEELIVQMKWAKDYAKASIKFIGVAEVFGALGLIFPYWLNVLPILTPLAAFGLLVIMLLAIPVHLRLQEKKVVGINVIVAVLLAFICYWRAVPILDL